MEKRLVWKTASGNFAPLITLSRRGQQTVVLTTVKEMQTGGLIPLFWKSKAGQEPADSIRIRNLPSNVQGKPILMIDTAYNGRNTVNIRFRTSEKQLTERILTVPPPFRSRKNRILPVLLPALLVLSSAVFLVFRFSLSTPDSAEINNPVQETAIAEKTDQPVVMPEDSPRPEQEEQNTTAVQTGERADPFLRSEPIIERIYFMPENDNLTPEAQFILDNLISRLLEEDLTSLTITGHCALFGTEEKRLELSLKRAKNTAAYLEKSLILPDTVRITGMGGKEPLYREKDKQNLNRRVEIELNP